MPNMNFAVNREKGNYESEFNYTLNAGFSGVEGSIQNAKIELFISDFLELKLGRYENPVKNVETLTEQGGTRVVFDFGSIADLGIAVRLDFGVIFKLGTVSLTEFSCVAEMSVNGGSVLAVTAPVITLEVIPDFRISRKIILPSVAPSAGSEVYYKVTLQNFGDKGALIENVAVLCYGSGQLILDDTFTVKGSDFSSTFADKSADDIVGVIADNILTFTIPSYSGEKYEFIYKAIIIEGIAIGTEIADITVLNINNIPQETLTESVALADALYNNLISVYGPDYTLPSEYICHRLTVQNNGNRVLENMDFECELSPLIDYYKFTTGTYRIGAIKENISLDYMIEYETENGKTGELGPFNTDVNSTVDLTEVLATGDMLILLRFNLSVYGIGVRTQSSCSIFGIVKEEVEINTVLECKLYLNYEKAEEIVTQTANKNTAVENICALQPKLSATTSSALRPGDRYRYNINVNCRRSRLENPIIALLLPPQLSFVGDIEAKFSDVFGSISPELPPAVVINNFNEERYTLIKFEFTEEYAYSFRQLAIINISFEVFVKYGAIGEISTYSIINCGDSTAFIPNGTVTYVDDGSVSDYEAVGDNYAMSNIIKNNIIFFVSVSSDKKIKGALDNNFIEEPEVGRTYEGGKLQYMISVQNTGNANLLGVEVVDILPYIGDVGVILTGVARKSDFPVYNISELVAQVSNEDIQPEIEIMYSKSKDPVRFGGNFNVIGTVDDWESNLPDNSTDLRAFKISMKELILKPAQILRIYVSAVVPVGVQEGQIAWNSLAVDVSYIDENNVRQRLLATEPEKVGIKVSLPDPDTVQIGGKVWFDVDANGCYDAGETQMNDVGVALLNSDKEIIDATFTAPAQTAGQGIYLFSNLPKGKYYIKFFIDTKKYKFTINKAGEENKSYADRLTGMTEIIDVTDGNSQKNINAGLIDRGTHTIEEIIKINKNARGMVRDVIKNQMLLVMKEESVLELIECSLIEENEE